MEVVLFDRHVGGHHLDYAARLQDGLEDLGHSITFLCRTRTERHGELFGDVAVLSEALGVTEDDDTETVLGAAMRFANDQGADALHLLHLDDVLGALLRVDRSTDTAVLGTVNGAFFRNDHLGVPLRSLLRLPVLGDGLVAGYRAAPAALVDPLPALLDRTVGARGCLADGTLDHVYVHSTEAAELLAALTASASASASASLSVVPDPAPLLFEEGPSRATARDRLRLPEDGTVLLYFGQHRDDKGVDLLLSALEQYDGPPFTMVFAGPPGDYDATDVATADVPDSVQVRADVEFVPEASVPHYFRAADAVVVPYRRLFGAQRTSGVFQRACGAGRPVIAPGFGTFQSRVRKYGLGTTFEPDSAASLAEAVASVVGGGAGDTEGVRRYAREQVFERFARAVAEGYPATVSE